MATRQVQERLQRLLLNMFSAQELERLVRLRIDGDLVQGLPLGGSPLAIVDALVTLLDNRSLLGPEFFEALIAERPRRAAEIREVAGLVERDAAADAPPAASTAASTAAATTPTNTTDALDFVAFTALALESRAVLRQLDITGDRTLTTGTLVDIGTVKGQPARRVGLVEIGAGNLAASAIVTDTLASLRPRAIVFVGVAGGIKDVTLGDVVASTKIYGYESGKESESGFLPRPDVGESSYRLVQRARAEARRASWLNRLSSAPDPEPQVHVAPIAAGEKVLANRRSPLFEFLRQQYSDAVAVEMEGRGFLAAAHIQRIEAIVIRGISDLVDHDKDKSDAAGWQPRAAERAAAFAAEIMANVAL